MNRLVGTHSLPSADILETIEAGRVSASAAAVLSQKSELGQYFTPSSVARLMAEMFPPLPQDSVRILDPGAGAGALFVARVEALCRCPRPPKTISVVAYEIEPRMRDHLDWAAQQCRSMCRAQGVEFHASVRENDFISEAAQCIRRDLFSSDLGQFGECIMNPPYKRLPSSSRYRSLLRSIGIEAENLYVAFLALSARLLGENGALVAITPRSFCNGPYFASFRRMFLSEMVLDRLHTFEARGVAFKDDGVLQENLIVAARRTKEAPEEVIISSSYGTDDNTYEEHSVPSRDVVDLNDPDLLIHVVPGEITHRFTKAVRTILPCTLAALGVTVSTGPVVDFRAVDSIVPAFTPGSVPLIYPFHVKGGEVVWPANSPKKLEAILANAQTKGLLRPGAFYVLVKRFTSKEQSRRLSAAVFDPSRVPCDTVSFENHLNYLHCCGSGLDRELALGIMTYLNSTYADTLLREFSGHTQVNSSDLRRLRFPDASALRRMGSHVQLPIGESGEADGILDHWILNSNDTGGDMLAITAKRKVDEALDVLRQLGLPRAQQNERSALTLLALLDLKPRDAWAKADSPLCGITPMMEFFASHYSKQYKPNTRETVRRQTVHQFLDAGLIVENPDDPERPTNSPAVVYQIESHTLRLLRAYGSRSWSRLLKGYLKERGTLAQRYAAERESKRIKVRIRGRKRSEISLSPGDHNELISAVLTEFASQFTPGATVVYVGDTEDKFAYLDEELAGSLGLVVDPHGKMPDTVLYYTGQDWLVLIEAVTSHGPIDAKRRQELGRMFKGCAKPLVYVTAFLHRREMARHLQDISWETEVWAADAPTHLIHFNGERFLGPYSD